MKRYSSYRLTLSYSAPALIPGQSASEFVHGHSGDDRVPIPPRWARRTISPPRSVGRHALVGQPHAGRRLSGLPEHVDRNAAARIPIAADAKPARLEQSREPFADADRAVLVKGAVIAEARQIEFQRFRFEQPGLRRVIDDQQCKIRLAGDRAQAGELRR